MVVEAGIEPFKLIVAAACGEVGDVFLDIHNSGCSVPGAAIGLINQCQRVDREYGGVLAYGEGSHGVAVEVYPRGINDLDDIFTRRQYCCCRVGADDRRCSDYAKGSGAVGLQPVNDIIRSIGDADGYPSIGIEGAASGIRCYQVGGDCRIGSRLYDVELP